MKYHFTEEKGYVLVNNLEDPATFHLMTKGFQSKVKMIGVELIQAIVSGCHRIREGEYDPERRFPEGALKKGAYGAVGIDMITDKGEPAKMLVVFVSKEDYDGNTEKMIKELGGIKDWRKYGDADTYGMILEEINRHSSLFRDYQSEEFYPKEENAEDIPFEDEGQADARKAKENGPFFFRVDYLGDALTYTLADGDILKWHGRYYIRTMADLSDFLVRIDPIKEPVEVLASFVEGKLQKSLA